MSRVLFLSFVYCDEAERTTSACERLGILRFSFTGFLKSILNSIILHPVSILPERLRYFVQVNQAFGGKDGVVRVIRT